MTFFLKLIFLFFTYIMAPCAITAEESSAISEQDWRSLVIRDPSLSAKCKRMIDERNEKIRYKQKIQSLIIRNTELEKETPTQKESIKKQLRDNHEKLKREKELNLLKIRVLTENIIKKGCPSIDF